MTMDTLTVHVGLSTCLLSRRTFSEMAQQIISYSFDFLHKNNQNLIVLHCFELISNFFRFSLETFSSSCVRLLLVNPSKNFRPSSKILGNRWHNNLGLISNFFRLLLETFSSSLIWLILAKPSKKFRSFSKILANRRHNNYLGHLVIYVLIHNWISIQFWVWGRRK